MKENKRHTGSEKGQKAVSQKGRKESHQGTGLFFVSSSLFYNLSERYYGT